MAIQALRFRVADSGDLGAKYGDDSLVIKSPTIMRLPIGCRVESVENQYGTFWLWVLGEETTRKQEPQTFEYPVYIVGPNYAPFEDLLSERAFRRLGACQIRGGEQVYLFYGLREPTKS